MTPFALASVYDFRSHLSLKVVTYEVRSYVSSSRFSLDLIGFAGTSAGALTTGGAMVVSYPVTVSGASFRMSLGPALIYSALGKPRVGFFGGISGRF